MIKNVFRKEVISYIVFCKNHFIIYKRNPNQRITIIHTTLSVPILQVSSKIATENGKSIPHTSIRYTKITDFDTISKIVG